MKIVLTIIFLVTTVAFAQTGPAGIGNSSRNGLWLRADALNLSNGSAVSTWQDESGNNNNALQSTASSQPIYYSTSALNNMPVIHFDGLNDEMAVPDTDILDGTTGVTFYAVVRPRNVNGAARGIIGKRITYTVNVEYAYTLFFYSSNKLYCDVHTNNDRFSAPATFSNSTNYILAMDFDGSLPSYERSRLYSNGSKIVQASESSTSIPNSTQDLAIGALNVGYGTYFGGDFAEIIHFNYSLDSVEHILVQNYLSAKYNISLTQNDVYDEDDNGDFDFEIAGIGRIGSMIHNNSKGSGMVQILNPSHLDHNEFMMWGHNGGDHQATELIDIPVTVDARLGRVWGVSESSSIGTAVDVGSVDLRWDLTGLGPVTASELRLLIDTDNDGSFADETPISGATNVGGNVYEFTGVSQLTNNSRFTLATANLISTPLPIELISFEANANDDGEVDVNWVTATEINNNYFTVERSNGNDWEDITRLSGAGNSSSMIKYNATDHNPLDGISYYRLKQTDYNGSFTYSTIVRVEIIDDSPLTAYPNPTKDYLFLTGSGSIDNTMIIDSHGRDLTDKCVLTYSDTDKINIDVTNLPVGVYVLRSGTRTLKFIKQ